MIFSLQVSHSEHKSYRNIFWLGLCLHIFSFLRPELKYSLERNMQMISSIEKLTNSLIIIPSHSRYTRDHTYGAFFTAFPLLWSCSRLSVTFLLWLTLTHPQIAGHSREWKGSGVYKRSDVSLYRLCGMNLSMSDLVINSILLS